VVMATTDGGSHWSSQINPANTGLIGLAAVACPSASTCYAVGSGFYHGTAGAVMTTADGGVAWTGARWRRPGCSTASRAPRRVSATRWDRT
jgi:photosystem II stability/assembly factor-like uncharacterized protein